MGSSSDIVQETADGLIQTTRARYTVNMVRFLVFLAIITTTCSQNLKEESKVFNYKVQFDPTVFLQSLDDAPVDTNDFDIKDFINNFSSANSPTLTIEQSTTSSAVRPTSK